MRGIPTNITIGPEEGIDHDSVASFDNLSTVPKSTLTRRLGALGVLGHHQICTALESLADC
jgi:mRNA interferase MazF